MKRWMFFACLLLLMSLLPFSTAQAALITFMQIVQQPDLIQAEDLAISPDGKHIYATGYGSDTLVLFERDVFSGQLNYVASLRDGEQANGKLVDGLNGASGVALSPDGKHIYVSGYLDQAVSVFARDAETGMLHFVEKEARGSDLGGAAGLVVSPDGKHVYVVANRSHAVVVFARDVDTGALTYVETKIYLLGLGGARDVVISPDGLFVYVSGQMDDAVVVFLRDEENGTLTHVESVFDGVASPSGTVINGLDGAYGLALSPDAQNLYVTGFEDAAIAVFSRDALTGKLTFLEAERNEIDDPEDSSGKVSGLRRPLGLTVSADGEYLFALGNRDNSLVLFQRFGVAGRLRYIETLTQVIDPVDGLARPQAVVPSPDGMNIYILSNLTQSVSVFLVPTSIADYTPEIMKAVVGSSGELVKYGDWSVFLPEGTVPDGSTLIFDSIKGTDRGSLDLGMTDMGVRTAFSIIGPDGVQIEQFSPNITVCFTYAYSHLWFAGKNPRNLFMGRQLTEEGGWQMLATYNLPEGQLCAEVDEVGIFEVFVPPLPNTGIAPGHEVVQPANTPYQATGGLKLVIEKSNIDAEIVGVPLDENGWQTDWLGDQVGFLNGSAFPTWSGNTVLTAHAWLGDVPGPFNEIENLRYGDRFSIHAWGRVFTYEVREVLLVPADEIGVISEKAYDWVTLITCQGYDEIAEAYLERLAVRAVLVSVNND